MVENFKGYKFAIQYDDDRGHTYAGEDFKNTKRLPGQKGNCITCKSSYMYDVYYKQSGWDYASKPIEEAMGPIEDDQWFGCSTCMIRIPWSSASTSRASSTRWPAAASMSTTPRITISALTSVHSATTSTTS